MKHHYLFIDCHKARMGGVSDEDWMKRQRRGGAESFIHVMSVRLGRDIPLPLPINRVNTLASTSIDEIARIQIAIAAMTAIVRIDTI
jgi:hypothetical protein